MTTSTVDEITLFYDGDCGLCQASVQFVLHRDRKGLVRFAPLQGETAKEALPEPYRSDLSTVVVKWDDRIYERSTAVAHLLKLLGPLWQMVGTLLFVIPRPLRDLGYRWVARTRHRFKSSQCLVPNPEQRRWFLP